jgi:hypothetical protein
VHRHRHGAVWARTEAIHLVQLFMAHGQSLNRSITEVQRALTILEGGNHITVNAIRHWMRQARRGKRPRLNDTGRGQTRDHHPR